MKAAGMRISTAAVLWTCAGFYLMAGAPSQAAADLQSYLDSGLVWLDNRDHNPAMAGLIEIDGKTAAEAAVGVRALGHPESVTLNDRWHIGSDTKAFTATLIGALVDRQILSWDETLEAALPSLAKTMHPAYRLITIRQLLSHTAGLPPLSNTETEFPTALAVVKSVRGVSAQRMAQFRR
jgi:CubicO group peptidase (beta-lactamase class C family)